MSTRNCSLEEFTARLCNRIGTCTQNAPGDSPALSERSTIDAINSASECLANELGIWMPYPTALALGEPYPSGVENEVFFDVSSNTVVKINNLMVSRSVFHLFKRLLLHNQMFPQTAYSLIGFTGFGRSSIYPVLRQNYITNATYATHGEILDYMEALGFTACGEAAFTNGQLTISDLRPRNVLKNDRGTIYVIDADFHLEN